MFLKDICAASPAYMDSTWKLRPHIKTEPYMFWKNGARYQRDITCIHRLHMEATTSYRNGGLYVFDKCFRDVTCIHRLHMGQLFSCSAGQPISQSASQVISRSAKQLVSWSAFQQASQSRSSMQ